jgi:hypothetical protein
MHRRTADEVHWDVACLRSFQDLSDAWVGLQVLRGICMSRRSKGQERIHVCELERTIKPPGDYEERGRTSNKPE